MEEFFRIGQVSTAHGVRGAMKIIASTSDPKRFSKLKTVLFSKFSDALVNPIEWHVVSVAYQSDRVLLSVEEVKDRDQAMSCANGSLWVPRADAMELKEGEFFTADFIGAKVTDDEGQEVGTVKEFYTLPSDQEVMVVLAGGEEILLPVIRECILAMDAEQKSITVHHRFYKDFV